MVDALRGTNKDLDIAIRHDEVEDFVTLLATEHGARHHELDGKGGFVISESDFNDLAGIGVLLISNRGDAFWEVLADGDAMTVMGLCGNSDRIGWHFEGIDAANGVKVNAIDFDCIEHDGGFLWGDCDGHALARFGLSLIDADVE